MAKNTLQNVHANRPHQLVFGQNPNLPSGLSVKSLAVEGTTKSKWVAKHISAARAAEKAFTKTECSKRIRSCLSIVALGVNTELEL